MKSVNKVNFVSVDLEGIKPCCSIFISGIKVLASFTVIILSNSLDIALIEEIGL